MGPAGVVGGAFAGGVTANALTTYGVMKAQEAMIPYSEEERIAMALNPGWFKGGAYSTGILTGKPINPAALAGKSGATLAIRQAAQKKAAGEFGGEFGGELMGQSLINAIEGKPILGSLTDPKEIGGALLDAFIFGQNNRVGDAISAPANRLLYGPQTTTTPQPAGAAQAVPAQQGQLSPRQQALLGEAGAAQATQAAVPQPAQLDTRRVMTEDGIQEQVVRVGQQPPAQQVPAPQTGVAPGAQRTPLPAPGQAQAPTPEEAAQSSMDSSWGDFRRRLGEALSRPDKDPAAQQSRMDDLAMEASLRFGVDLNAGTPQTVKPPKGYHWDANERVIKVGKPTGTSAKPLTKPRQDAGPGQPIPTQPQPVQAQQQAAQAQPQATQEQDQVIEEIADEDTGIKMRVVRDKQGNRVLAVGGLDSRGEIRTLADDGNDDAMAGNRAVNKLRDAADKAKESARVKMEKAKKKLQEGMFGPNANKLIAEAKKAEDDYKRFSDYSERLGLLWAKNFGFGQKKPTKEQRAAEAERTKDEPPMQVAPPTMSRNEANMGDDLPAPTGTRTDPDAGSKAYNDAMAAGDDVLGSVSADGGEARISSLSRGGLAEVRALRDRIKGKLDGFVKSGETWQGAYAVLLADYRKLNKAIADAEKADADAEKAKQSEEQRQKDIKSSQRFINAAQIQLGKLLSAGKGQTKQAKDLKAQIESQKEQLRMLGGEPQAEPEQKEAVDDTDTEDTEGTEDTEDTEDTDDTEEDADDESDQDEEEADQDEDTDESDEDMDESDEDTDTDEDTDEDADEDTDDQDEDDEDDDRDDFEVLLDGREKELKKLFKENAEYLNEVESGNTSVVFSMGDHIALRTKKGMTEKKLEKLLKKGEPKFEFYDKDGAKKLAKLGVVVPVGKITFSDGTTAEVMPLVEGEQFSKDLFNVKPKSGRKKPNQEDYAEAVSEIISYLKSRVTFSTHAPDIDSGEMLSSVIGIVKAYLEIQKQGKDIDPKSGNLIVGNSVLSGNDFAIIDLIPLADGVKPSFSNIATLIFDPATLNKLAMLVDEGMGGAKLSDVIKYSDGVYSSISGLLSIGPNKNSGGSYNYLPYSHYAKAQLSNLMAVCAANGMEYNEDGTVKNIYSKLGIGEAELNKIKSDAAMILGVMGKEVPSWLKGKTGVTSKSISDLKTNLDEDYVLEVLNGEDEGDIDSIVTYQLLKSAISVEIRNIDESIHAALNDDSKRKSMFVSLADEKDISSLIQHLKKHSEGEAAIILDIIADDEGSWDSSRKPIVEAILENLGFNVDDVPVVVDGDASAWDANEISNHVTLSRASDVSQDDVVNIIEEDEAIIGHGLYFGIKSKGTQYTGKEYEGNIPFGTTVDTSIPSYAKAFKAFFNGMKAAGLMSPEEIEAFESTVESWGKDGYGPISYLDADRLPIGAFIKSIGHKAMLLSENQDVGDVQSTIFVTGKEVIDVDIQKRGDAGPELKRIKNSDALKKAFFDAIRDNFFPVFTEVSKKTGKDVELGKIFGSGKVMKLDVDGNRVFISCDPKLKIKAQSGKFTITLTTNGKKEDVSIDGGMTGFNEFFRNSNRFKISKINTFMIKIPGEYARRKEIMKETMAEASDKAKAADPAAVEVAQEAEVEGGPETDYEAMAKDVEDILSGLDDLTLSKADDLALNGNKKNKGIRQRLIDAVSKGEDMDLEEVMPILDEIEALRSEMQDRQDNTPEQFQDGDAYANREEAIEALSEIEDELREAIVNNKHAKTEPENESEEPAEDGQAVTNEMEIKSGDNRVSLRTFDTRLYGKVAEYNILHKSADSESNGKTIGISIKLEEDMFRVWIIKVKVDGTRHIESYVPADLIIPDEINNSRDVNELIAFLRSGEGSSPGPNYKKPGSKVAKEIKAVIDAIEVNGSIKDLANPLSGESINQGDETSPEPAKEPENDTSAEQVPMAQKTVFDPNVDDSEELANLKKQRAALDKAGKQDTKQFKRLTSRIINLSSGRYDKVKTDKLPFRVKEAVAKYLKTEGLVIKVTKTEGSYGNVVSIEDPVSGFKLWAKHLKLDGDLMADAKPGSISISHSDQRLSGGESTTFRSIHEALDHMADMRAMEESLGEDSPYKALKKADTAQAQAKARNERAQAIRKRVAERKAAELEAEIKAEKEAQDQRMADIKKTGTAKPSAPVAEQEAAKTKDEAIERARAAILSGEFNYVDDYGRVRNDAGDYTINEIQPDGRMQIKWDGDGPDAEVKSAKYAVDPLSDDTIVEMLRSMDEAFMEKAQDIKLYKQLVKILERRSLAATENEKSGRTKEQDDASIFLRGISELGGIPAIGPKNNLTIPGLLDYGLSTALQSMTKAQRAMVLSPSPELSRLYSQLQEAIRKNKLQKQKSSAADIADIKQKIRRFYDKHIGELTVTVYDKVMDEKLSERIKNEGVAIFPQILSEMALLDASFDEQMARAKFMADMELRGRTQGDAPFMADYSNARFPQQNRMLDPFYRKRGFLTNAAAAWFAGMESDEGLLVEGPAESQVNLESGNIVLPSENLRLTGEITVDAENQPIEGDGSISQQPFHDKAAEMMRKIAPRLSTPGSGVGKGRFQEVNLDGEIRISYRVTRNTIREIVQKHADRNGMTFDEAAKEMGYSEDARSGDAQIDVPLYNQVDQIDEGDTIQISTGGGKLENLGSIGFRLLYDSHIPGEFELYIENSKTVSIYRELGISSVLYAEVGEMARRMGIRYVTGEQQNLKNVPIKIRKSVFGKGSTISYRKDGKFFVTFGQAMTVGEKDTRSQSGTLSPRKAMISRVNPAVEFAADPDATGIDRGRPYGVRRETQHSTTWEALRGMNNRFSRASQKLIREMARMSEVSDGDAWLDDRVDRDSSIGELRYKNFSEFKNMVIGARDGMASELAELEARYKAGPKPQLMIELNNAREAMALIENAVSLVNGLEGVSGIKDASFVFPRSPVPVVSPDGSMKMHSYTALNAVGRNAYVFTLRALARTSSKYGPIAALGHLVAHEIGHTISVTPIKVDAIARNQVVQLMDEARSGMVALGIDPDMFYGMTSPVEFATEAMSNPVFASVLNRIQSYQVIGKGKSLVTVFQKFLRIIKDSVSRMIGVEIKAGSVLDAAVHFNAQKAALIQEFPEFRGNNMKTPIPGTKVSDDPVVRGFGHFDASAPDANVVFEGLIDETIGSQPEYGNLLRPAKRKRTLGRMVGAFVRGRYFSGISAKAHEIARRYKPGKGKKGSAAALQVANMIHARPGVESRAYEADIPTAIDTKRIELRNRFVKIMEPLRMEIEAIKGDKLQSGEAAREKIYGAMVDMIEGRRPITKGELGQAAQQIRDMLQDMNSYQEGAGVLFEDAFDFYPHIYNDDIIRANPDKFLEAAADAYYMRLQRVAAEEIAAGKKGVVINLQAMRGEADILAKEWLERIMTGLPAEEQDSILGESRELGEISVKKRKFNMKESQVLSQFMVKDPFRIMGRYINQSVQRAEVARVFGHEGKNWRIYADQMAADGVSPEEIKELRNLLRKAVGQGISPRSKAEQGYMDTLSFLTAASFMGRSFLNNLVEPAIAGVRTGNPLTALHSLGSTWARLIRMTAELSPAIKAKIGPNLEAEIGRELGLIHEDMTDAWAALHDSDLFSDESNPTMRWLTNRVYQANLMNATETAKREASVAIARRYIQAQANWMSGKHWAQSMFGANQGKSTARASLRELGIPDSEHQDFVNFVNRVSGMDKAQYKAAIMSQNSPMAKRYREAMKRFSRQSSIQVNRAHKPEFQDNTIGRTLLQLMNYSYAFTAEVNSRLYSMLKYGLTRNTMDNGDKIGVLTLDRAKLLAPGFMAAFAVAAYYWLLKLKDLLYPTENTKLRKQDPAYLKTLNAASYTGLFGPKVEMLVKASQRGQVPGGPVGQLLAGGVRAGVNFSEALAEGRSADTAARQLAQTVYRGGIKPAIMGGASAINPYVGAAANTALNDTRTVNLEGLFKDLAAEDPNAGSPKPGGPRTPRPPRPPAPRKPDNR